MDFLLALIELFSLGVTAEALCAIIGSKSPIFLQWGSVDPKFQVEGVVPPPTILLLRDHACDRRTDRQTDGRTNGQNSPRYTASALHAAR